MREICTYGSEGGAAQANASSLPLYVFEGRHGKEPDQPNQIDTQDC
jgi:hypothetical protein